MHTTSNSNSAKIFCLLFSVFIAQVVFFNKRKSIAAAELHGLTAFGSSRVLCAITLNQCNSIAAVL